MALKHPSAVQVYTEQMLELHRGQGMEIYWRDEGHCPTEEEYRTMAIQKTGGLFNLAVRLMQLFQQNTECTYNYGELANLMGLYFQIRDDFANLCLDEYTETKTFAEDLTEGKFNFPIIHGIRNCPGGDKIKIVVQQKTHNLEIKKYCVSLLADAGSFEYSKIILGELEEKIRNAIDKLGANGAMLSLMDKLADWRKVNGAVGKIPAAIATDAVQELQSA